MRKHVWMGKALYSIGRVDLWVYTFIKFFRVYNQMDGFIVCKLYLVNFMYLKKHVLKVEMKIKVLVSNDIIRWLNLILLSCHFEKPVKFSSHHHINVYRGSFPPTEPQLLTTPATFNLFQQSQIIEIWRVIQQTI